MLVYDIADRDSLSCIEALYQLLYEVRLRPLDGQAKPVSAPRSFTRVAAALRSTGRLFRRRSGKQDSTPQCQPPFPLVVIANKTDKPQKTWAISIEEGVQVTRRMGGVFFAVSALRGTGCDKGILKEIVTSVIQRRELI